MLAPPSGPTQNTRFHLTTVMIGQTVSNYRIEEQLGKGGMGIVYRAVDTSLQRSIALKFLPPQLSSDEAAKRRFIQEAQAASSLDHPNICTIHQIGETDDGRLYIAMSYYDGQTLKYLQDEGTFPLEQCVSIVTQIAEGLERAHRAGIVHRDIKPANIMVTSDGLVKILDFGVAKLGAGKDLTQAGSTVGTISYMSPEQALGEEVDVRADIWSLGVVFYEMMSGRLPFRGAYEQAIIYSLLNEDPRPLSDVPPEIERIVWKMLQKDPAERYRSVQALLGDLSRYSAPGVVPEKEAKEKAIAVLPFDNMSSDEDTDYFADGLAEELIVNLSGLKDIRVVPRATSIQYKDSTKDVKTIGRELRTDHIITGSVRKYQDKVRISVQLLDVASDAQLWAETYKGTLADVFDIQEEVSKKIVGALMLKLSPEEEIGLGKRMTSNPEAFDLYLRARDVMYDRSRNGLDVAVQMFLDAVKLDARFAAAYAGLGESYATIYRDFEREDIWLDRALQAGLKALMYDATLSEAYAALGLAYFGKGALDEALVSSQKAIDLDNNNYNAYWILARIYHTMDRDEEAVAAIWKAIESNSDFLAGYCDLMMYLETMDDWDQLYEILPTTIRLNEKYLKDNPTDNFRRMAYATLLTLTDRLDEARMQGEKSLSLSGDDPVMTYYGVCLYSRLGDKERAIELLEKAISGGYENYEWIARDPDLIAIRGEPGYHEIMRRSGIDYLGAGVDAS